MYFVFCGDPYQYIVILHNVETRLYKVLSFMKSLHISYKQTALSLHMWYSDEIL